MKLPRLRISGDGVSRETHEGVVRALHTLKGEMVLQASMAERTQARLDCAMAALTDIGAIAFERRARNKAREALARIATIDAP